MYGTGKIAKTKSMDFSVRMVNLHRYLSKYKKEYVISKQVLRSGTSIGANIAEAESAMSKKDFLSKIYIALKECSETLYWIDLLFRTDYITKRQYDSLKADCIELKSILSSTTITTMKNLNTSELK